MMKCSWTINLFAIIWIFCFQGCENAPEMYLEVLEETPLPILGSSPCAQCTVFSGFLAEGFDGGEILVNSCPNPAAGEKQFGSLENFLITDIHCTNANGITNLTPPCQNLSTNCGTNDETFPVYVVREKVPNGDVLQLNCCDVLNHGSIENAQTEVFYLP